MKYVSEQAYRKICYVNVEASLLLKIYLYFLFFLTNLYGFDHRKYKCVHKTVKEFPKIYLRNENQRVFNVYEICVLLFLKAAFDKCKSIWITNHRILKYNTIRRLYQSGNRDEYVRHPL